jgi:tetratricopeptide (TPR) repeat protein
LEKSVVLLERAHRLDAHHPGIQSLLCQAYRAQGETQKAVDLLQTTAKKYPNLQWPYLLLGEVYKNQGSEQEAIALYERAIEQEPGWVAIYLELGKLLEEVGNSERAEAIYRAAAEVDARSVQPYLALARLFERQDAWAESVAAYRQALAQEQDRDWVERRDNGLAGRQTENSLFDHSGRALDSALVDRTVWYIDRRPQRTLFQHPPSRIDYRVRIPRDAKFVSSLALSPETWQPERGDGVQFEVYVSDRGVEERVFSQYIDPKNVRSDRRWHDLELDLAPWAGRTVVLGLVTTSGPMGDDHYDWAGWGEPRIVQPVYYAFMEQFERAEADAGPPNVRQTWMTIEEETRPILFQHPPSRIIYPQVYIPEQSTLQLGLGVDPEVWSADMGDGIEFQVWVQDGGTGRVGVYRQYLDPKHDPEHRHWLDVEIELERFAGHTVEIHFVTLPGPAGDARYDWGGWSAPVLVPTNPAQASEHGLQ